MTKRKEENERTGGKRRNMYSLERLLYVIEGSERERNFKIYEVAAHVTKPNFDVDGGTLSARLERI